MGQKQSFVTGLTDVWPINTTLPQNGARDGLGSIRPENTAVYKYVQFSGTTAVNPGDVVCYVSATSDGGAVIVDNANTAAGAGVAMGLVPAGQIQYGWIQIKGIATLARAMAGTPTPGQSMTTAGAGVGTVTLAAAVTNAIVGVAYDVPNRKMLCDFPY